MRPVPVCRAGGRAGAALLVAVFVALASMVGAHALLVLSRAELAAAGAHRDLLFLQVAGDRVRERWLRTDTVGLPDAPSDSMVQLDSIELGGAAAATLWAQRISSHLWWLGTTSSVGSMGEDVGEVVRQLDVDTALDGVRAAVELDGGVGVRPLPAAPVFASADSLACSPADAVPVSRVAEQPHRVRQVLAPSHVTTWAGVLPELPDSVGHLDAAAGTCGTGWNWGDPFGDPCPWGEAAAYAPSTLRLTGGEGRAALFVEGDLVLRRTSLYGMVVTTGALRLLDGSTFVGLARVGGGLEVSTDSGVEGSACWARAVLEGSPVRRPHPIPGRARVRPDPRG